MPPLAGESFTLRKHMRWLTNIARHLVRGRGEWLIDNKPIDYSEEATALREALISTDPDQTMDENIQAYRTEADYQRTRLVPRAQAEGREARVEQLRQSAEHYDQLADTLEQYRGRLTYRTGGGNVYTVQLDVDDPELLDWFMPMREQTWVFDKVRRAFGSPERARWRPTRRTRGWLR